LIVRIFEFRQSLDCVLRTTRKDDFSTILFQLAHRNCHIVAANTQKAACADDGVSHRLVGHHDDVIDFPNGLTLIIEDILPKDLAFGAPACRDVA
jgi:hypothetical protein